MRHASSRSVARRQAAPQHPLLRGFEGLTLALLISPLAAGCGHEAPLPITRVAVGSPEPAHADRPDRSRFVEPEARHPSHRRTAAHDDFIDVPSLFAD